MFGAGLITYQIQSDSHANTARRKGFHLLAILVYIPGLLWEPTLLYLASGVIMGGFIMLEVIQLTSTFIKTHHEVDFVVFHFTCDFITHWN